MANNAPNPMADMSTRQKLVQTYRMTRKTDRWIGWLLLVTFLVAGAIGFTVFMLLPGTGTIELILGIVGGLMFGTLATMFLFGRRAEKAGYAQMDGEPGAAAAALRMLRRGWKTDPAIGFTRQQDIVHRVVGPPGIVLVGEGNPNRLRQLMTSERKKHERVASEVPIHEVYSGNGDGQVPLPQLVKHVRKLGRDLKPAEMTDVLNRLKALDAQRSIAPIPKGPVPTSMKGQRGNLRGR